MSNESTGIMTQTSIDELWFMAAQIGAEQTRYHQFFYSYSDQLERSAGEFMGDTTCVLRSSRSGPFDFEHGSYFEDGIGFDDDGWYCIPLMVRVNHFEDSGYDCLRIVSRFSLEAETLTMSLAPGENTKFEVNYMESPCAYFIEAFNKYFARDEYFNNRRYYQAIAMGFSAART